MNRATATKNSARTFILSLVALAIVGASFGAASATAATTSVVDGKLRFVADSGSKDDVTVSFASGKYRVVIGGAGSHTPGPGCEPDPDSLGFAVFCTDTGITRVEAELGDLNDQFYVGDGVTIGVTLDGGDGQDLLNGGPGPDVIKGGPEIDGLYGFAGNDSLDASDGGMDAYVDCGSGVDTANGDQADRSRASGCETGNLGIPLKVAFGKMPTLKTSKAKSKGVLAALYASPGDKLTIVLELDRLSSLSFGLGNKATVIGKLVTTVSASAKKGLVKRRVKLNSKGKKACKNALGTFKVKMGVTKFGADGSFAAGAKTIKLKR